MKAHLEGKAAVTIEGIPITEQGYKTAVTTLKERFDLDDLRREIIMKRLLDIVKVDDEHDLIGLRNMIDRLVSDVRALETMGVNSDAFAVLLLPVLKTKIPESWRLEWLRFKRQTSVSDEFSAFLTFLKQEVNMREESAAAQRPTGFYETQPTKPDKSAVSMLSVQQDKPQARGSHARYDWLCKACNKSQHGLSSCNAYKMLSVEARWRLVRQAGLCFQCLGPHHVRDCHSTMCPMCGAAHHSSLHVGASVPSTPLPMTTQNLVHPLSGTASAVTGHAADVGPRRCNSLQTRGEHCFVQTALVVVEGPKGKHTARALIDGGSDSSFIRDSLAEKLGLPTVNQGTFMCVGFQERMEETRTHDEVTARLQNRHSEGEAATLNFWKVPRLCAPLKPWEMPDWLQLPPDVQLADDFSGGPVDLLIGADQMYRVILWNQLELAPGLRLVETMFGHVLHGVMQGQGSSKCRQVYRCQLVEKMWDLDTVGVAAEEVTEKDAPVPTWNAAEGRYEMKLLWKSDLRPVSNLTFAEARTNRMTQKLTDEQFQEYEEHLSQLFEDSIFGVGGAARRGR